jgi:RND family efflux transporter MFP subunit
MSNHEAGQAPPRLTLTLGIAIGLVICYVAGAIAYSVVTGLASRARAATTLKQQTLELAVPAVSVIHPKRGAMTEEVVLPGNAQAYVATPIFARTNGYLSKWYFDIGARVKSGQLLVEIETPEIDRQLDQARADLATTQANLDLSKTTADRYQALFKSDSVAKQDVEDKVGDLQAKKAMVDSASYNVKRLEETQRFQKVYAPFDGVITARNVDYGALINAGGNAPGKELFDIASTSQLRVYVNVPQMYSRDVKPGGRAELTLAEFPGRRFPGKSSAAPIRSTPRRALC